MAHRGLQRFFRPLSLTVLWSGLFLSLWTFPLRADVKTFYSDVGFPSGTQIYTWSSDGTAGFNGSSTDVGPPEGFQSFKSTGTASAWFGWGVFYDKTSGGTANPQDFSFYKSSGEARFWIRSSTNNIKAELEYMVGQTTTTALYFGALPGWNWSRDHDQWKLYRFALSNLGTSGVDFTKIRCPLKITALARSTTFYTDFVRWTSSSTMPIFNVTLRNISDNSTTTQVSWSTDTLKTTQSYARANQYIQVDLDPDPATYSGGISWGLQIYTDNTASDADPKFTSAVSTGQPGSDPAGLVDVTTTAKTLSMAWSVKPATSTVPGNTIPPVVADPNNANDPNTFQWLFFKDRGTPTISGSGTTAFSDGEPYIAVKNNLGIHFVQGTALDSSDFGAANSPNYIYLEANFAVAVTPRTYKTTTIRLEFYHP